MMRRARAHRDELIGNIRNPSRNALGRRIFQTPDRRSDRRRKTRPTSEQLRAFDLRRTSAKLGHNTAHIELLRKETQLIKSFSAFAH
eukprot:1277274-Pyramimonas_sp.AAC.1